MNNEADAPGPLPTGSDLAYLDEYWWHSQLIDPIKRGDLPAIHRYLAQDAHDPKGLATESPSYYDPFIVAAQQPDPGALRLLLAHWAVHPTPGAPPPNERGSPLLNVACAHGALDTARYLLDEQPALAGLHARSARGYTPVLEAAASLVACAMDERDAMVARRSEPATLDDEKAARERVRRSEALVALLLDRGASARDSALCAVGWGTSEVAENSHGDSDGDTVLSLAIARAGPELLRRLIDESADAVATTSDASHHPFGYLFEKTGTSSKLTLLHLAAFYGNYSVIQVLLEYYQARRGLAIVDALACQDQFGRLPIHYAAAGWPGALCSTYTDLHTGAATASTSTLAMLLTLTDSGNPRFTNAPDQSGDTPLHYAVSPNLITGLAAVDVTRFLCKDLHASVTLRGRGGETPLHRVWHDRPHFPSSGTDAQLTLCLLSPDRELATAQVNAVDDAGNTPLHLAARYFENIPAVGIVLKHGADVRTRNASGRTALHEAAGGQLCAASVPVGERIRAQDAMLSVLCGITDAAEEGVALEKNWNALMDEEDGDGKTPRQIAGETRAAWREEEVERARPWDGTRGRGRGRGGRGVGV